MQRDRILVTGGSGFIGTNMVDFLLRQGKYEVLNLDNRFPRNKEHVHLYKPCDVLDAQRLAKLVKDFSPTHVVHLAARCGLDDSKLDIYAANMEGVQNMIDALRNVPTVERVIFTSTLLVAEMGYVPKHDTDYRPTTMYGRSKVEGEKIVRAQKDLPFAWTIIRPISIWGPWGEEPYINLFRSIAGGWYFHVGSGHFKRSLGYVENSVYQIHGLLTAPREKVDRKTMYVADNDPADLYDFAAIVKEITKARNIPRLPLPMVKLVARTGDILKSFGWSRVPLTSFRLKNICTEYIFDMSPIMSVSGPLPYDLKTGIERTITWLRNAGELKK
ncbi:MAG: NAD(P)-dependent oxidoreductase [Candidatus Margulisbacteria bacterium]|nr:NAD(P)-dependent oxidoreductase [Candidatus Margulisiibacteriota bacterium]